MSRILVTGAAGFIGSHVCEALLRRGDTVIGLDNFDDFYDPAIKHRNLEWSRRDPRFEFFHADVRDLEVVRRIVGGDIEAIVHLAARAGVRPSIDDPLLYTDVNVCGTVSLLQAASSIPGCRFILASSSSVYGDAATPPFKEDDRAAGPLSPYAASKRGAEHFCHAFHHLYGMSISCLRFFTVYGPRQRPDLAIHKFVRLIEAGEPIPLFGDGRMRRDYTYISDIVDGVLRALDRCRGFDVYNLGNSQPVSLIEMVQCVERVLDRKANIGRLAASRGDVECTYADITKAERELGWWPRTDFADGLRRFVEWFRREPRVAKTRSMPAAGVTRQSTTPTREAGDEKRIHVDDQCAHRGS